MLFIAQLFNAINDGNYLKIVYKLIVLFVFFLSPSQ